MDKYIKIQIIAAVAFWSVFFVGGSVINSIRNKSIYLDPNLSCVSSEKELERILEEEKVKKGLENVDIDLVVSDKYIGGHSIRVGENRYRLTINPKRMSEIIIRHELYHIYRKENPNFFILGPIEEWMATSYSLKE